jgi:FAD/FMN-containing dehydrogenase
MAEWSNWSGLVACNPSHIALPASESAVAELVTRAREEGKNVRVCGSGHSFQPLCATSDLLISLDRLAGIESINVPAGEATILAGTKLHDLGEPLAAYGLALENQGDVDVQALAGAVSTGTHGTGRNLGSISTQVIGLRLIAGDGTLHEFNLQSDLDTFRAFAVSLGSCGVLTAIRMRLMPAYRLHERTWREPIEECLRRLQERITATRHFEFFWYPQADEAYCKALQPTNADPSPLDSRDGERIDHNYRVFPTVRNVRFNEMEYAVPEEAGEACFSDIRKLMRERHPDVTWPVEYRTVAADELDLSPNYGRPTIAISIHQAAELEHRPFFADAEPIFRHHGGRPHWGKLHSLSARELAPLYPRWQHFASVRERFDPQGIFLNDHLRRILVG